MKKRQRQNPLTTAFTFKKLDTIGAAAAEDDSIYLADAFVDTGALTVLRDCADARRIVLGTTGSGKTALLLRLKDVEERVIEVLPESLALAHVSNSTVLQFFSSLGVKLDVFFRLLWRHVLAVELLRAHFAIRTEQDSVSVFAKLLAQFKTDKYRAAIRYLEHWGRQFWLETERRIKEVTTTLENDLAAAVAAKVPSLALSTGSALKLSETEKAEVVSRAQHVVNQIQIRQLSELIDLAAEALSDPQKRYFIVIDKLDTDWVEDRLRYFLIRALIETVRDFRRIPNAKIVIALRHDLIDRVFRLTRDAGFQEEKYESLYLRVDWTREALTEVVDRRVNTLIRRQYTKEDVGAVHILPGSVRGQRGMDYLLDRTMLRPRDVILFINQCIPKAVGRHVLSAGAVTEAEGEYSRLRLRALADEWYADYPNLIAFTALLKGRAGSFPLSQISQSDCEEFCISFELNPPSARDWLSSQAKAFVDCVVGLDEFREGLMLLFYRVGLVGLKLESYEATMWSRGDRPSISAAEVDCDTRVHVHKAFWRTLGIRER